jgi:hypothetical protein
MHTHTRARARTHTHTLTPTRTRTHTHTHARARTHTHSHTPLHLKKSIRILGLRVSTLVRDTFADLSCALLSVNSPSTPTCSNLAVPWRESGGVFLADFSVITALRSAVLAPNRRSNHSDEHDDVDEGGGGGVLTGLERPHVLLIDEAQRATSVNRRGGGGGVSQSIISALSDLKAENVGSSFACSFRCCLS